MFKKFSRLLRPDWIELVAAQLLFSLLCGVTCDDYASSLSLNPYQVTMNLTYRDPATDQLRSESEDVGRYGVMSRKESQYGIVVHARMIRMSDMQDCAPPQIVAPPERWIMVIDRRNCKLTSQKIQNIAAYLNTSAIIFYSSEYDNELDASSRKTFRDDAVYVFIPRSNGERIASLVENGTRVYMHVSHSGGASSIPISPNNINKTSMLFLAISFIILMIISMAWLIFYYIQRSRYTYAKQRLSRRMMSAAKKAITRMPLKTVRGGAVCEEYMEPGFDLCAICIEGYKSSDVVRILPCKHVFHKHCIDPWLIDQRNCPICKTDILKAFGLQVYRSRESIINVEAELGSASYGYSEFGVMESGAGGGRDFDSDGVEIVRFQLTQIECHTPAAASTSRGNYSKSAAPDVDSTTREYGQSSSVEGRVTGGRRADSAEGGGDCDISNDSIGSLDTDLLKGPVTCVSACAAQRSELCYLQPHIGLTSWENAISRPTSTAAPVLCSTTRDSTTGNSMHSNSNLDSCITRLSCTANAVSHRVSVHYTQSSEGAAESTSQHTTEATSAASDTVSCKSSESEGSETQSLMTENRRLDVSNS